MHRRGYAPRYVTARDAGHHSLHLVGRQAAKTDPVEGVDPPQLGQRSRQRVRPVNLHVTVGPHDHQPGAAQVAGHMGQHLQGAAIGVVQVLQHDEQRLHGCGVAKEGRDGLEQPIAVFLGLAGLAGLDLQPLPHLGHYSRHIAGARAQLVPQRIGVAVQHVRPHRLYEGKVWQGQRALLIAVADEGDAVPEGYVGSKLLGQGGLADAGLAHCHRQRPLARHRAVEGGPELPQLGLEADEGVAVDGVLA